MAQNPSSERSTTRSVLAIVDVASQVPALLWAATTPIVAIPFRRVFNQAADNSLGLGFGQVLTKVDEFEWPSGMAVLNCLRLAALSLEFLNLPAKSLWSGRATLHHAGWGRDRGMGWGV